MIGYLNGEVRHSRRGLVILNVNGVGYRINVNPQNTYEPGLQKELFIHHHIREDVSALYGFENFSELETFELLLSVNGVGPKAALSIVSIYTPERIYNAISADEATVFVMVPGIGKKVAAKIILELQSKVSGLEGERTIGQTSDGGEVTDALTALGYKQHEVIKILTKMPSDLSTTESKIRWCLKNLAK